jgi:hypothetical protein
MAEVYRSNIHKLVDRGTYTAPAHNFPGARYTPMSPAPPAEAWEEAKQLWQEPGLEQPDGEVPGPLPKSKSKAQTEPR